MLMRNLDMVPRGKENVNLGGRNVLAYQEDVYLAEVEFIIKG